MKTGRNDPCHCGSGKKYKKCCLAKDQEESSRQAVIPPGPSVPVDEAPAAPVPPDPIAQRAEGRWQEFKAQEGDGRIAVFLETLEDAEVMDDDMAFEMLGLLHADAEKSGSRTRFGDCVGALRERRPEVFAQGAHFYLSWCLLDALAENRQEVVPSLARELARNAGRDIDTFNRAADALGYHGQLDVLVEALRVAWPLVKSSDNVVPWGVSEFAERGADHEVFSYLENTASPDPADAVLLDRVGFYVEELREGYLREFIDDLTGKSGRRWQADDFALKPPRKQRRKDGDAEHDQSQAQGAGAMNLHRLICEFVGYLRREQGAPFPRGKLVSQELYRYFLRRNEGELDPRLSMLAQAIGSKRKLPKPPRPAHPLCPERITLDVYLSGMLGMLSQRHHPAAALFQAIPAWLRFLESRRLIDADTSRKVAAELRPLHDTLQRIWKQHTEDPNLYRQGQAWPADG
ncbi:MAG TPA: SEC-C metal-binding domain-containing protein [Tepidisphaeraceae bacterium]|nr:SEC-C metal-binding domain-containing protein [Tepidisphaeraceae bacterium]